MQLVDEVRVGGKIFSVRVEPLFDGEGEPCGFMRLTHDVTGERSVYHQLLMSEQLAALGQLFSSVAHDVGTPLNVISGYAEFLLMRTKPEDRGYKELSSIRDQTTRIAAMFRQVLDVSRPPLGLLDAIDLQSLLAESLALIDHQLRRTGLTASVTCRMKKPLIYGEASQLRLAVFNVLLNAGQSIGAGGSFQVVIDEAANKPGFVGLALLGIEAGGTAHDFSTSFAILLGAHSDTGRVGIGLHLARRILVDAGAVVLAAGGEHGLGLMIYLPVNGGSRPGVY